jgi:Transcriptional activator, adenine-specific DNA methyltransferase
MQTRSQKKPHHSDAVNRTDVSIHARHSRAKQRGSSYAAPKPPYPPEDGGFKPDLVFDEEGDDLILLPTSFEGAKHQDARRHAAPVRPEGYPVATDNLETLLRDECQFGAIMADPPWRYSNTVSNGAADRHYPTMSMEALRDLPVPQLALPDAYLFLWATAPLLPEALDLMEAWGFAYKTHMIWNKPRFGMGNYWRSAHELLCLGIRGKPTGWCRHNISSWAVFPITRHSAKPSYFRDMITSVVDGPYLEMFGREQNSGWTTFGNQVQPTLFSCFNEEDQLVP